MKLISWNVNGLRAVIAKGGFLEYLEESNADIFLFTKRLNYRWTN